MRITVIAAIAAGVCAPWLLAQTLSEPDISGTWVQSSNGSIKWVLAQKDGKMHVHEMDGDRVVADFSCAINGEECAVKEDGRPEKVMMYYNGPVLVSIRERGNEVLKQRLAVSGDGKTLRVETVPFSNSEKSESMTFERQSAANSNGNS
jgi:hypothetical protein